MSRPAGAGSARARVASLGYHDVGRPEESGFQRPGALPYKLDPLVFSSHLDAIAAGPVIPELVTQLDLTSPGRHLLLTFDDGGKSALRIGEELQRRGWRGHFFISTGLIGRRTFLDRQEIRELRQAGHLIGSHSHTHPDIYRELSWERMVVEWRQSCDTLAQLLGEACDAGAVPGGDTSAQVFRSGAAAGLRFLFTSDPRLDPRIVGGCWVLGRFCTKVSTSPDEIARLARFEGWSQRRWVRRFKSALSRTLPPLYRMYVGRSTREWQEAAR
jgi:hypothetical protein